MTPRTQNIVLYAVCAALAVSVFSQRWEITKLREENDSLRHSPTDRASVRKVSPRTREAPVPNRSHEVAGHSPATGDEADPTNARSRTTGPGTGGFVKVESGEATFQDVENTARSEASADTFGTPLVFTPAVVVSAPMVAGKVHWDHAQATGAPDTKEAGDLPTAWAPRSPRSGEQWLALGYETSVEISEINIHESHSSGAISKVTALLPDGSEKVLWSGVAKAGAANEILETSLPVPRGITGDRIKIYVDTDRVQSWPEIDAVELVGTNGVRQWASSSQASSSYSETYSRAVPATVSPGPIELESGLSR